MCQALASALVVRDPVPHLDLSRGARQFDRGTKQEKNYVDDHANKKHDVVSTEEDMVHRDVVWEATPSEIENQQRSSNAFAEAAASERKSESDSEQDAKKRKHQIERPSMQPTHAINGFVLKWRRKVKEEGGGPDEKAAAGNLFFYHNHNVAGMSGAY